MTEHDETIWSVQHVTVLKVQCAHCGSGDILELYLD